ncbi:MAG: NAD(+) diphosphatase [Promethearchaeota archaeon]
MNFKYEMIPSSQSKKASFFFIFQNNKILVQLSDADDGAHAAFIPSVLNLSDIILSQKSIRKLYFGLLKDHPCYLAEVSADIETPENTSFMDLRRLYSIIEEDVFWVAGRAFQIMNWDRNSRYCGRCGSPTEIKYDEKAKICPKCNLLTFPRISPAIIVGVIKENQILLANNTKFPSNLYSVIAGFLEPGENLEQCVRREVKEEVGIDLKNIRYFKSQSWPFPDSLMLAFLAEYAGGKINVDEIEIKRAGWFTADNLPRIPSGMSVSRKIIDHFMANY